MKNLIYVIFALGVIEIVSNLYHLLKGSKEAIGLSAKRQHQELSLELDYKHFYIKAVIMFVFGLLFTASGLVAYFTSGFTFFSVVLILFAFYGIAQALLYRKPWKVWMSALVYIAPLLFLLLLSCQVKASGQSKHQNTHSARLIVPVYMGIEPMEKLLVASFTDDPEFEMFEPQFFDDSINGKGMRILRYRRDKTVDVYWQPGVKIDTQNLKIGAGLKDLVETEISPARFDITEKGVDMDIAFTDKQGRRIELAIIENSILNNRFPFLAPVGKDVEKPSKLFLVYMKEFDFVKREGTIFRAKVGDRILTPATFPIRRDKQKTYFIRYAQNIAIGEVNPPASNPIVIDNPVTGLNKVGINNVQVNEKQEVEKIWVNDGNKKMEVVFEDGLPNLNKLVQNKKVKGSWKYIVTGNTITGGTYTLLRNDDLVSVELDVTQNWKPGDMPASFKIFTGIARSFRNWPTTYKWQGSVNLENLKLKGQWIRK